MKKISRYYEIICILAIIISLMMGRGLANAGFEASELTSLVQRMLNGSKDQKTKEYSWRTDPLFIQMAGGDTAHVIRKEPLIPSKASIYGQDIAEFPTERLVKKANIIGRIQTINIKGNGKEFDPLIIVLQKDIKARLMVELTNLDELEEFVISNIKKNVIVTKFNGMKGVNKVEFSIDESGSFLLVQNDEILAGIEVVDDLKSTDIAEIRSTYFGDQY